VDAVYYAGWFMAFYVGFTLIEIPHKAWGTDIIRNYVDRSAVATFLGLSFAIGNLMFAASPFLPGLGGRGYDAETLRLVAIAVVVLLPLSVGLAIWLAPQGKPVTVARLKLAPLLKSIATNRPFLQFLAVFVLAGFGQGIFYGLVFMFVGSVEGEEARFPVILVADAIATFVAVPLWFRLIARFEKHRAWGLGMLVSGLAVLGLAFAPAGSAGFPWLVALVVLRALGGAVIYVAPNALLGDVVDYDILRTGANPAGNYHAAMALVTKANGAVGGGLGLILVGLVGFSAKGHNPPATVWAFKLIVLAAPALLLAASSVVAWLFPLDRRRHDIVRRRILARSARAPA
jgi:GPH family glycoside/pentoside/hexuronide:cation symporter